MNIDIKEQDCAVCLQKCHHPTQLPCGHVFCFLCVKGVAIQSRKCAMCRAAIPPDYLDHPVLLEKSTQENEENGDFQWYYEGRNGWWKYDERSNAELETAFNSGEANCALLLAGALYNIDFQNMIQIRRGDPTRRRKVRRDTPTLVVKGIAGIKNLTGIQIQETKENNDHSTDEVIYVPLVENEVITIENDSDDDNADINHVDSNSSQEIVDALSSINLVNPETTTEHVSPEDT
ncbi:hypothetical protein ACJJTC_014887 [Scirpophaga incertulas]